MHKQGGAGEVWAAQTTHSSCTAPSNIYKLLHTGYLLSARAQGPHSP